MKEFIKRIPIIRSIAQRVYRGFLSHGNKTGKFQGSAAYWEKRYSTGGSSGAGSYSYLAEFKADVLNGFVAKNHVQSVIDFGCGDGNQLRLAKYPSYLGLDVSGTAITQCRKIFEADMTKEFRLASEYKGEMADLAISMDVIYHLVEDDVFERYMHSLFSASRRYVIIYASDSDDNTRKEASHVKHRRFSNWVHKRLPRWKMIEHLPNPYPYHGNCRKGSFADFFIYEKIDDIML